MKFLQIGTFRNVRTRGFRVRVKNPRVASDRLLSSPEFFPGPTVFGWFANRADREPCVQLCVELDWVRAADGDPPSTQSAPSRRDGD
jgi:hypothetical protein